jgi:two-component system, NarL family, response regulator NreC
MRILIADDNQLVRRGIIALLSQEPTYEICGEASNSAEAIQKAADLSPDIVLLDISMPGESGLETARVLKQQRPEIKILMISQHDPKQMLSFSVEAGAEGCIDKGRLAFDLLPAIKRLEDASRA